MTVRVRVGVIVAAASLVIATGCANSPAAPSPGRSAVWGYVRLVPHAGVPQTRGTSYGDRRLADVELVDYSQPGFAVVYQDAPGDRALRTTDVTIHEDDAGTRLEPEVIALQVGSRLRVTNETETPRVLSCPAAGLVERIAPGASAEVTLESAGPYPLFVIGAQTLEGHVFVAPGPFAVVSRSGRFEINDARPGRSELRSWHPRFPPTSRWLELTEGLRVRQDIEIGVGQGAEATDAP